MCLRFEGRAGRCGANPPEGRSKRPRASVLTCRPSLQSTLPVPESLKLPPHISCLHPPTTPPHATHSSGAAELKTNFVSDKPSSWYSELYRRDGLTGGHVIMLGADDASK